MTTQQQTERDEALIAEARKNLENTAAGINGICAEVLRLERSGWTPPATPDRYVVTMRELLALTAHKDNVADCLAGKFDNEPYVLEQTDVLRKHFPSVEVPEDVLMAARRTRYILGQCDLLDAAHTMADHILKGDQ